MFVPPPAARRPPPAGVAVLQAVDSAADGVGVELSHGEQGAQHVAMRSVLVYIPGDPIPEPAPSVGLQDGGGGL